MKSIVYIFIALIAGSILFSAIPKSGLKTQSITIQCIEKNPSVEDLQTSANIIKTRLADYGIRNIDVSVNTDKSGLDVLASHDADFKSVISLMISPAKVGFYEVYDRVEAINMIGENSELATLLNISSDKKTFARYSGILGYCKEDKKSAVEKYLKNYYVSKPGEGIRFCWSESPDKNGNYYLFMTHPQAAIDNSNVANSLVQRSVGNKPGLSIIFDTEGTIIWEDLTRRNIGKSIAMVLDERVLSAPVVQSVISGGNCIITGNFSDDEINWINALIKHPELPLRFKTNE